MVEDYIIGKSHDFHFWQVTSPRRSERGNTGNSRGSRYIYYDFSVLVLFSPYVSIVVMTLHLSCVRPSLIKALHQALIAVNAVSNGPSCTTIAPANEEPCLLPSVGSVVATPRKPRKGLAHVASPLRP